MSFLSGFASKGEKAKSKYKSFNINDIYSLSRGETFEQHQQKNTLPRKHGMQSLGKVPSARRPPANLPSLKSEHSGSDPAVSLVPTGGSGWAATKDSTSTNNTTATTTSSSSSDTVTTNSSTIQCASGPSVSITQPPAPPPPPSPVTNQQQNISQSTQSTDTNNKSWSAIMSRSGDGSPVVAAVVGYAGLMGGAGRGPRGTQGLSFLAHQSPQFQHEFPSLSGQLPPPPSTTQNQIQQPSTTSNTITMQHHLLLQQQSFTHNHSGTCPQTQQGNREGSAQYGPGPSLRPQTEGSWIQGGGGKPGGLGSGNIPEVLVPPMNIGPGGYTEAPGGGRSNLGQSPGMGLVQVGPSNVSQGSSGPSNPHIGPNMHHYKGIIPSFMYRGSFPAGFPSQFPSSNMSSNMAPPRGGVGPGSSGKFNYSIDRAGPGSQRSDRERSVDEEIIPRPIIKEEDLTRMDDISKDAGWAAHDDIDYNQKLAFSDDESESEFSRDHKSRIAHKENLKEIKKDDVSETKDNDNEKEQQQQQPHRNWMPNPPPGSNFSRDLRNNPNVVGSGGYSNQLRGVVEDESVNERRKKNAAELAQVTERARLRKEEEEKKYLSSKQAAARKFQTLENKFKEKENKMKEEAESKNCPITTMTNNTVTTTTINLPQVPLPLPDWERDKDTRDRERSRTNSEDKEDNNKVNTGGREFRENSRDSLKETSGGGENRGNFSRQESIDKAGNARDIRDREHHTSFRHFQNNLPPRFQKQQAERAGGNGTGYGSRVSPTTERIGNQGLSFSQHYEPGRWAHGHHPSNNNMIKQNHSISSQRRSRLDSDVSNPADEERPPSRDYRMGGGGRDDRYRHASHRSYETRKSNYYDDYNNRNYRDYEYDDNARHSRESWEREKHFDDKEQRIDSKDSDDHLVKDQQQRSSESEWRDERMNQERGHPIENRREDRMMERNERPQRPDSRDSRTSRESKNSSRDDESHNNKSNRDCTSWINDIVDYQDKKRDLYHEEGSVGGPKERDRRQPPGPVTKDKLEANELKSEKRNLIQLKRAGSEQLEKRGSNLVGEINKETTNDVKQETGEVWNRKSERIDNSPKAWADAVSPTFEKEDTGLDGSSTVMPATIVSKESKETIDKSNVDKMNDKMSNEDSKDDKRDKNIRNRTNSGSSSGRGGRDSRGGRQWGTFSVYPRGWRSTDSRGRKGSGGAGGYRPPWARPGSARSGSYGHTDSEMSGDEISGSTESGKEDKRTSNRSKIPPNNSSKSMMDDRRGDMSRRDDDKRMDGNNKMNREGFAPSGEPSRRGRGGGYRRNTNNRMDGYGGSNSGKNVSSLDDKQINSQNSLDKDCSVGTSSSNQGIESNDDKMITKQQALNAGIVGRRNKSPNHGGNKPMIDGSNKGMIKKEGLRYKRNRSQSQKGRDNRDSRGSGRGTVSKLSSQETGNEDWETTSENSEDHISDSKESRGGNSNRNRSYNNSRGQNALLNVGGNRRNDQSNCGPRGEKMLSKSSTNPVLRNQGGSMMTDKRNIGFGNQRSNHPSNIPPLMSNPRTRGNQNNNNSTTNNVGIGSNPSNKSSSTSMKDTLNNRMDDLKLNDKSNDVTKKPNSSKDKKSHDCESDSNEFADDKNDEQQQHPHQSDSEGFQQVRSKKNVKESRLNLKDNDNKPMKREKDMREQRDRSKSKSSNGGGSVTGGQSSCLTQSQVQNIPPLLGQNISQPVNVMNQKRYDNRNPMAKAAPRFQKPRIPKQQLVGGGGSVDTNTSTSSGVEVYKMNSSLTTSTSSISSGTGGAAPPPPTVNAWEKPITNQLRSNSPSLIPGGGNSGGSIAGQGGSDTQFISSLSGQIDLIENNEQLHSGNSSQRNSPSADKIVVVKSSKDMLLDKSVTDVSSPPVQTLIFENTNYSKTTKTGNDLSIKSKFSNHIKSNQQQQRNMDKRSDRGEMDDEGNGATTNMQQQQTLSAVFSNKPNDLMKDKVQESMQMPLSFNKNEDNADMKLDFNFDSDLSQLTDDKNKSLGITGRSMHMSSGQSNISPSTAELNLKIASVKKVWENAPPMPTVVEHDDNSTVSTSSPFQQGFESNDVDDGYNSHQQYAQSNMKNEISTSTNVCKLVPPQVKPQQQSSGSSSGQTSSTVPGPSPIGAGPSPIGHPSASLQGPLSPPPFNSTGQPSHINYQEFPQYPGSQTAQYSAMPTIPSPPTVLFNTGSGQLPTQAGGLYGTFQLDQSRSPFTQYPPYAPSMPNSFNQQNVYLQQPPPPPHAQNAPTPDIYQSNLSQYRLTATAAPPFGQNQQLSNNPNTVLINSSSNSLMSASVKPSSQQIGAIGTKAPHFQAPSAPQPNQLAYIPYDPNQVLGVSGSYMGSSQLVQRPGHNVQPSANSYYSATSADVFPGSQTGFYQPGGATQQTAGTHYGLQGFGQHNQNLATGNATPVGLQNFSSGFLSSSGLQITAAAAQQFRNPSGGLPGNAAATFLNKHQPQEQPRQLKSPSGNQDVLASVFSSTSQIPSPKSRNCKQSTSSQQPQPSPTQHHKYPQYQSVGQSALVSSCNNYVLPQNVRGMGMPPRAGIQPSAPRYPPPIQRPVVPFGPSPTSQQSQQQSNCMGNQSQQQPQSQINRHRSNIHQQQQRGMKIQQQYYTPQASVKMDQNEKNDTHVDKMNEGNESGNNNKTTNQQDHSPGDQQGRVNQPID